MGDSTWDTRAPNRSNPPPPAGDPPVETTPLPDPPLPPAELPPPTSRVKIWPITDPADGEIRNRGYSYWPQAWIQGDAAYVFVHAADGHPKFFRVALATGQITKLGALLDPYGYQGEGEGLYWNGIGRIYLISGSRLRMVNPFAQEDVLIVDVADHYPGCDLWQAHSADFDYAHSMTIRQITSEGTYPKVGTLALRDGQEYFFVPTLGELDESAISGNGRYLLIKESPDDDNRIIDLAGQYPERILRKSAGALGHSDMGPDWAIGDDRTVGGASWINLANPDDRRVLVRFPDWNMGHVSVQAGRCLLTHGDLITLLDPQTGAVTVITPHGMVGSDYNHQVFANLDPTGRVAVWVSNQGTDRMDAFLAVLP